MLVTNGLLPDGEITQADLEAALEFASAASAVTGNMEELDLCGRHVTLDRPPLVVPEDVILHNGSINGIRLGPVERPWDLLD
jgi:hypothetical protein